MNVGTIFTELVLDSSKYQAGLKNVQQQSGVSGKAMENALGRGPAAAMDLLHMKLRTLAGITAAAFSTHAIYAYAKEATMLAARLETMSVVLGIIGKNAGYSSGEMKDYVDQVKKMGITTSAAQDSITKMAQANLDLSKASKLARVAQDAAVIGNTNSSDAFQRMVYGIKTAQTEILRTIGINVSFESSYAKLAATLGKSTGTLTQAEKAQARLNAVLTEGEKIQGSYEAAMQTTAKLINSLPRYFEEVKEKVGELFSPALGIAVRYLTEGLKDLGKIMADLSRSGDLAIWANSIASALKIGMHGVKDFGNVIGTVAKEIWGFKEYILILGAAFAAFKVGILISGMLVAGGAISVAIASAQLFFTLWSAGLVTAGTIVTIFGESVRAAFIKMSMGHPIILALTIAITAGIMAWQKWGNAAENAINKATSKSEDDWTRFHSQLSQMKFGVINPDETAEYASQLKKIEDAGVRLSEKEKHALKERISGYYEGSKLVSKFTEEIKALESVPFKNDVEKTARGIRIFDLNQMIKQIALKQELANLEAKDALVQKQALKDAETKASIEQGAEKITAQTNQANIDLMKARNKDYFENRNFWFDNDVKEAYKSGKDEISIAQMVMDESLDVSGEKYKREIQEAEKSAAEKIRINQYGFDKEKFMEVERDKASKTRDLSRLEAIRIYNEQIEKFSLATQERILGYQKQVDLRELALSDASFDQNKSAMERNYAYEEEIIDKLEQFKRRSRNASFDIAYDQMMKETEFEAKKAAETKKYYNKETEQFNKLKELEHDKTLKAMKDKTELAGLRKKFQDGQVNAYASMYSEINQYSIESMNMQIKLIKKQAEEKKKYVKDHVLLFQWEAEKIATLQRNMDDNISRKRIEIYNEMITGGKLSYGKLSYQQIIRYAWQAHDQQIALFRNMKDEMIKMGFTDDEIEKWFNIKSTKSRIETEVSLFIAKDKGWETVTNNWVSAVKGSGIDWYRYVSDASKHFSGVMMQGIMQNIGAPLNQTLNIMNAAKGIISFVKELVTVFPDIMNQVADLFNTIGNLGNMLRGAFKNLADSVVNMITGIPDIVEGFVDGITYFIEKIPDMITALINAVPRLITALIKAVPNIIGAIVRAVPQIVKAFVNAVPEIIREFVRLIPDMAKEFVKALIDALKDLFSGAFGGIGDAFGSIGDFFKGIPVVGDIIGGIEDLISSINPFHSGGTVGNYSPISRPISALAFANAPRAHMGLKIDEVPIIARKGERVLNPRETQAYGTGNESQPIEIHLFMDRREIGYAVADETKKNPILLKAIRRAVA